MEKPTLDRIRQLMATQERKAWTSLCRYKFEMFGYHSSRWVMLNRLLPNPQPNPWHELIQFARESFGFVKK